MRKIKTLYRRDPDDMRHVIVGDVTPGCEWALTGQGTPTRKYDGTCVMLDNAGEWWARREVKPGKAKPPNFIAVEHDETTGKTVGWEPITQSSFAKFHAEAVEDVDFWSAGTYELIGPKINGNPEGVRAHLLIQHSAADIVPGDSVDDVIAFCREQGWEGVVWHGPDGGMAKLKVRDIA